MTFIEWVLLMVVPIIALGFVLSPGDVLPVRQSTNGIEQSVNKFEIVGRRTIHEYDET